MDLRKVSTEDYVEKQHGPIYNFLYSFKTHFLTFMSVNILYFLFNIPMLLLAFAFTIYILPILSETMIPTNFVAFMNEAGIMGNEVNNDVANDAAYQFYYLIVVFCSVFLVGSGLFTVGPFQVGFHRIFRNFYREEGVFIFSDFKEGMKENYKQSIGAMIISFVVTAVDLLAVGFYMNLGTNAGTAFGVFFILFFFAFIVIQSMVYQMIVSVDMPLHKMYRNAFLFFIIKFGPCVGIISMVFIFLMLIPFALIATTTYAAYGVLFFYYTTLIMAFIQYMMAFFTGELITSFIGKAPGAEDDEDDEEDDDEDEDDDDDDDEDDEEEVVLPTMEEIMNYNADKND